MENSQSPKTAIPPQEKKLKKKNTLILFLGAFLIALISFSFGVKVGLIKARFSYHWGENYERNFSGPRPMPSELRKNPGQFLREFERDDFRNAHGLAGTIISITNDNIVIKDQDDKENTVTISEKTVLKKFKDTLSVSDLKTSDKIVVLGRPGENGTIIADLIRVFESN